MATMAILHIPAHPSVSMDPVISITASFWAWDHGLTGAITTVGAGIVSTEVEEDATLALADMRVDVVTVDTRADVVTMAIAGGKAAMQPDVPITTVGFGAAPPSAAATLL